MVPTFVGGEKAMDLPPSMSFGKIYHYNDTINGNGMMTTTTPPPIGVNAEVGDLPFRTFVMLIALTTQILITELTHHLFVRSRKLSLSYDFFNCYVEG